jgi:hypothetical protein
MCLEFLSKMSQSEVKFYIFRTLIIAVSFRRIKPLGVGVVQGGEHCFQAFEPLTINNIITL